MHSYIIQACGEWKTREPAAARSSPPDKERDAVEIRCATSAPKWPEVAFPAPFFSFSNMTWQLLLCLFSFYKEKKNSRPTGADALQADIGMVLLFSMTTVKWAACWHSEPQSGDDYYKSVPSPPSSSCQNDIPDPWPGWPSYPLMNQIHWSRRRERQGLMSTWLCLPIFFFLALAVCKFGLLPPLLHLSVSLGCMINPQTRFKAPAEQKLAGLYSVKIS